MSRDPITEKSLPNPRHELYARLRAKGANMNKAGIAAGFAQGSSTASELEKDPDVIARIEEIKAEESAKREGVRAAAVEAGKQIGREIGMGKAWVIQKLAENAQMAAQDGDYKESNQALKLIGDELGMFQGGSAEPTDDNGVPTYNMDTLDALSRAGAEALEDHSGQEIKTPSSRDIDPEVALSLIAGHGKNARAPDRRMSTGSETDAAFLEEDDDVVAPAPPEDEDDVIRNAETGEVQWKKIDPKTPPEEILRMMEDQTDERPRRRSRS